MPDDPDHFILICAKCRGDETVAALGGALASDLPAGYGIRAIDCMAGCDRPLTVGVQAKGKASYLFGDIEGDDDLKALTAFARQYQASETGWTSATERPAALYTKTIARLPALLTGAGE